MMLGHLGHIEWGDAVMRAIERVVAEVFVYAAALCHRRWRLNE